MFTFGDSFPFGSLAAHAQGYMFNDFRIDTQTNKSFVLNLLECPDVLDRPTKGSDKVELRLDGKLLTMSYNYLQPRHGWTHEDIEGIDDRCFSVLTYTKPIPKRDNSARSKCRKCCASLFVLCACRAENKLGEKYKTFVAKNMRWCPDVLWGPLPPPSKKNKSSKTPESPPAPEQSKTPKEGMDEYFDDLVIRDFEDLTAAYEDDAEALAIFATDAAGITSLNCLVTWSVRTLRLEV